MYEFKLNAELHKKVSDIAKQKGMTETEVLSMLKTRVLEELNKLN